MNIILRVFLLAATLAIAAAPLASANEIPSFPFLLVKGEATTEVRPDKATFSIHVSSFESESSVAVETVQKRLVELLETLARHSIPKDAITSFKLMKEVERARKDRAEMEIVGYHVSRRVKVELADLSQFAELVADIAKIDNVSSLDASFDVTNRDGIELKLMNEAGADARGIAENMVHGMSRTVGPVYGISESSFRSSFANYELAAGGAYYARMGIAADYQQTVFQPSTIELSQTIHVIFVLE